MSGHAHCEPIALESRDDNARVAHGKEAQARRPGSRREPAPSAPRGVGCAATSTHVDGADDSSPARGEVQTRRRVDAAARSPGAALPLTLLPQRAGAATADAGRIDHAQAPIGFSASLVRHERLAGGTTERAIGLEGKVLTREAALFPGQAHLGGSIARGGSRVRRGRRDGRSPPRWCAPDQDAADGPAPGEGSTLIG